MKLKIDGTNDDLKEVAKALVGQNVGFSYDGENTIKTSDQTNEYLDHIQPIMESSLPSIKIIRLSK